MEPNMLDELEEYDIKIKDENPNLLRKNISSKFYGYHRQCNDPENPIVFYNVGGMFIGEEDGEWFYFKVKDDYDDHVDKFFSDEGNECEDIKDDMFEVFEVEISSLNRKIPSLQEKAFNSLSSDKKIDFVFLNHTIIKEFEDGDIYPFLGIKRYNNINIEIGTGNYVSDAFIIQVGKNNHTRHWMTYFDSHEERLIVFILKELNCIVYLKYKAKKYDLFDQDYQMPDSYEMVFVDGGFLLIDDDDSQYESKIHEPPSFSHINRTDDLEKQIVHSVKNADYATLKAYITNKTLSSTISFTLE